MATKKKTARRPARPPAETAIAKVIRETMATEPALAPFTTAPGTWAVLAFEAGAAPREIACDSEAGALECVRALQAAGNVGLWLRG